MGLSARFRVCALACLAAWGCSHAPLDTTATLREAVALHRQGQYGQALERYNQLVRYGGFSGPELAALHVLRANAYLDRGQPGAALWDAELALQAAPWDCAGALYWRGKAQVALAAQSAEPGRRKRHLRLAREDWWRAQEPAPGRYPLGPEAREEIARGLPELDRQLALLAAVPEAAEEPWREDEPAWEARPSPGPLPAGGDQAPARRGVIEREEPPAPPRRPERQERRPPRKDPAPPPVPRDKDYPPPPPPPRAEQPRPAPPPPPRVEQPRPAPPPPPEKKKDEEKKKK